MQFPAKVRLIPDALRVWVLQIKDYKGKTRAYHLWELFRFHGCHTIFLNIRTALLCFGIKQMFPYGFNHLYIIIHSAVACHGCEVNTCWINKCLFWLLLFNMVSLLGFLSPLVFSWMVTTLQRIKKEAHLLFPHCGPAHPPVCVDTEDRRNHAYFNKRFSDHGRMDALNRAEYTVVLLSRQLPDWEQLSGRTPSMCLDYHRVLEWLELLMSNQCPGLSPQSNWSIWDPWETWLS